MTGRLVLIVAALVGAGVGCAGRSTGDLSGASVRLVFVGDTHGHNIAANPALEGRRLLAGVSEVLDGADVVVFNHEGTLIESSDVQEHCRTFERQSTFATSPTFAELLALKSRAVAGLANNHAMDCGPEGLTQTQLAFAEVGVLTAGAGSDLSEACRPVEMRVDGVDIAFLSYLHWNAPAELEHVAASEDAPGVATLDGCDSEATVRRLAPESVVVVSLHAHFGSSWTRDTAPEHLSAVRRLLEWGADVVVSHGPHLPQGVLADEGRLAFLSLGNFMFRPDYRMPPEAHQSLLALVELRNGRVAEARLYPVDVTAEGLPVLTRPPASSELLALISGLSAKYGASIVVQDGFGVVRIGVAPEPAAWP